MSERTTIGGTVYEAVGSSSSNLLLKCNGTARIQWGNKLIDLVKNGKIASGDGSVKISVISNESDIKSDGIYVLNSGESSQLWIRTGSKNYNLTGAELYISASTKQDIPVEQQKQALENIGIYYNTLEELQSAGIQDGIAYVIEDRNLYTIKNGLISEFEAKLKTVSVEQESEEGESINSSVKIVLSVTNSEYLILENNKIQVNKDMYVSNSAKLCSEAATNTSGYRLYMNNGKSYLEVDYVKVRFPEENPDYISMTLDDLDRAISSKSLKPQNWYLISDYCNPWRFPKVNEHQRPILVKALTTDSLYPEGCLLSNRLIALKYDISIRQTFVMNDVSYTTKGMITWMKDENGNEANFDFLDYADANGIPLATLHYKVFKNSKTGFFEEGPKSIFPIGSTNNRLNIRNLKGTVIENDTLNILTGTSIDFNFPDSIPAEDVSDQIELDSLPVMNLHDNIIDCYELRTTPTCTKFYNNSIINSGMLLFESDCYDNTLDNVYTTESGTASDKLSQTVLVTTIFPGQVSDFIVKSCSNSNFYGDIITVSCNNITKSEITATITNSTFKDVSNSTINAELNKTTFQNLNTCIIGSGNIENLTCRSDLSSITIDDTTYPLLYDSTKIKDVYYVNGEFKIQESTTVGFSRGMIMMYSGLAAIPEGWAICDGSSHNVLGETVTTPNLVGRFIKAVGNTNEVGSVNVHNNGESNAFQLTEAHLPEHSHPHSAHSHTISEITGTIEESGDLTLSTWPDYMTETRVTTHPVVESVTLESETPITVNAPTADVIDGIEDVKSSPGVSGGNHTHTLSISGGTISDATSEENSKTWENQSFMIEPNYYSLIFIMKL
jgi:microcystin-dependent protein